MNSIWPSYWSAHQRFFKCLCIAAKVEECVKITKDAIKNGNCVVIGIQSTGDAQIKNEFQNKKNINEFISSAK